MPTNNSKYVMQSYIYSSSRFSLFVQSEAEKLQRLRERVESQEAKLKKIRAMRGQVDYSKLINGNLCTPEHTRTLHSTKVVDDSNILTKHQLIMFSVYSGRD